MHKAEGIPGHFDPVVMDVTIAFDFKILPEALPWLTTTNASNPYG
jgi:hypothetical protein